mgnify:CR=1 FL=1
MPIRIPDQLPATEQLESENIFVMTEHRAMHQDIRPLRVLLLNLMPKKIETETQIMRKLSNTPLQIEVELLHTISHESRNVSQEHLKTFYRSFDQVKDNRYDGMIITGAPVELHEFEDVDYWDELCNIMKWSTTNVHSTLHICWGRRPASSTTTASRSTSCRRSSPACSTTTCSSLQPAGARIRRPLLGAAFPPHHRVRRGHRGGSALGDRRAVR